MTVLGAVVHAYNSYYERPNQRVLLATKRLDERGRVADVGEVHSLVKHYEIQSALRPLFGKGAPVDPSIGDHPDFEHLKRTFQVENSAITTLFMDMEGSTRLGLMYDLNTVYRIKNAFICSAIDIIKSFDGHVHRIMGDAVMAYFGGKSISETDGAIDAINCAAVLRTLLEHLVDSKFPDLSEEKIGMRIGVDFGPKEKVLWSAYGYPGMEEVTATSFHVDVAAKLQHCARKNHIMLGQTIVELLDFPIELLQQRTVKQSGEEISDPYIEPNHTGRDGKPINYRKYELKWNSYAQCTQLVASSPDVFRPAVRPLRVVMTTAVSGSNTNWKDAAYLPCSRSLPKSTQISYRLAEPISATETFALRFSVENHGKEASKYPDHGNHTSEYTDGEWHRRGEFHLERTQYRGLHYVNIAKIVNGKTHAAVRVGVYVQ